MRKSYKSARGKVVDMSTIVAKNEKVPAVGNMKVNARGDVIDPNGKILVPLNERISEKYAQTVGNKSAQMMQPEKEELTAEELSLEESLEDDLQVEEIKKNNG
jgi:hypothetical protein